jgi:Protein of unknown function (DUF3043)
VLRRRRPGSEDAPGQDAGGAVTAAAADGADADTGSQNGSAARSKAVTAGKGRPTPKRSEAERRRQPFNAPKDRKEANRVYRTRERTARQRQMEAMRRGEDWALPPRDRGPVKALARDYVDSRRRLSEFYMVSLLVLLAMMFIPAVAGVVPLIVLCAVVIMIGEGFFIGRRVRAIAGERLPGQSTRGIAFYAGMRALQLRRMRVPKPRIKPGESY